MDTSSKKKYNFNEAWSDHIGKRRNLTLPTRRDTVSLTNKKKEINLLGTTGRLGA